MTNRALVTPIPGLVVQLTLLSSFSTLRPEQNGCHWEDNILKCIPLKENIFISIQNLLKYIAESLIALHYIFSVLRQGFDHQTLYPNPSPTMLHNSICGIPQGPLLNPLLNTLRPRQNGRHFADDILKCIFLNENVWIPIEISLKFVP